MSSEEALEIINRLSLLSNRDDPRNEEVRSRLALRELENLFPVLLDIAVFHEKYDLVLNGIFDGKGSLIESLRRMLEASTQPTLFAPALKIGLELVEKCIRRSEMLKKKYLRSQRRPTVTLALRMTQSRNMDAKRESALSLLSAILSELFDLGDGEDGSKVGANEIGIVLERLIVDEWKKVGSNIKRNALILIGCLARYYPNEFQSTKRRFISFVFKEIKLQMSSQVKTPILAILEGAYKAANDILYHFDQDVKDVGGISLEWLVGMGMRVIEKADMQTRHGAIQAAVALLSNHIPLFAPYIFADQKYQILHKYLMDRGSRGQNLESKYKALESLDVFMNYFSQHLPNLPDTQAKKILQYFGDEYYRVIKHGTEWRAVAKASRGYSFFSGPIAKFDGEAKLKSVLTMVLHRAKHFFNLDSEEGTEYVRITYMIDFVESFVHLLQPLQSSIDPVDNVEMNDWLEDMNECVVKLVGEWWRVDEKYTKRAIHVLVSYLHIPSAVSGPIPLQNFVEKCLLNSWSLPPIVIATNETKENVDYRPTARSIVPLWSALVNTTKLKNLDDDGDSGNAVQSLTDSVFTSTIKTIQNTLNQLNLKTVMKKEKEKEGGGEEEEEEEVWTTNERAVPVCQSDFWIIINIVDFVKHFIPKTKRGVNLITFESILQDLIACSRRYPSVSGFYKLMSIFILGQTTTWDAENENRIQSMLSSFVTEILQNMEDMREDLLVSVLEFILALPYSVLSNNIRPLIGAIKKSLEIGLSFVEVGCASMEALERWNDGMPPAVFERMITVLLPVFDTYLKSFEAVGEVGGSWGSSETRSGKRGKKALTARRQMWKYKSLKGTLAKSQIDQQENDSMQSQMFKLRKRILLFLCNNPDLMSKMVEDVKDGDAVGKNVVWDSKRNISITIPFPDLTTSIDLQGILSNVSDLAVWSGVREQKVAAAEFVHSVTLHLIGTEASQTTQIREREPMDKIYSRLFPVLIKLACDPDQVLRQLFRPLMDQLIHWFVTSADELKPSLTALFNAITEGLEEEGGTVREYAGSLMNTFLQCTLQHRLVGLSRMVFEWIVSNAQHPSSLRRLAASTAFNYVYSTFRDEKHLVNIFCLILLQQFLMALKLTQNANSKESFRQIRKSLSHLSKIVSGYIPKLLQPYKERINPTGLDGSLTSLISWMITGINSSPQNQFAAGVVHVLTKLDPHLDGKSKIQLLAAKCVQSEGCAAIVKDPVATDDENPQVSSVVVDWLKDFQASLNARTHLISPPFDVNFDIIRQPTDRLYEQLLRVDWTIEKSRISQQVGQTAVALLEYFTVLLEKFTLPVFDRSKLKILDDKRLVKLVAALIFEQSKLCSEGTNQKRVNEVVKSFIQAAFKSKLISGKWKDILLHTILREYSPPSAVDCLSSTKRPEPSSADETKLERLTCYLWLFQNKLFPANMNSKVMNKLGILNSSDDGSSSHFWADLMKESGGKSSSTTFRPPSSKHKLFQILSCLALEIDPTSAAVNSAVEALLDTRIAGGGIILSLYGDKWAGHFAHAPDVWLKSILNSGQQGSSSSAISCSSVEILVQFVRIVGKSTHLRKALGMKVQSHVLSKSVWEKLSKFGSQKDMSSKYLVIKLIQNLALINSTFLIARGDNQFPLFPNILSFYCQCLTFDSPEILDMNDMLEFKNKCLALLLGPISTRLPEDLEKELAKAVEAICVNHLPLRSTELRLDTREWNEYMRTLDGLFDALEISQANFLLNQLCQMMCRESAHQAEDVLTKRLADFCAGIQLLPDASNRYLRVLKGPYEIFMSGENVSSDELRRNCLDKIILPMLSGMSDSALSSFFLSNIVEIMKTLDVDLMGTAGMSDNNNCWETTISTQIGCLKLLQLMYTRLSADRVKGNINDAFFGGKRESDKTGLLKKVILLAQKRRSEGWGIVVGGQQQSELYWSLRCAAHNTLIAVVAKTQDKEKIFNGYLFKKDIWEQIMQPHSDYQFHEAVDDDENGGNRRFRNKTMRLMNVWKRGGSLIQGRNGNQRTTDISFLSSAVLASSSLSQSIQMNPHDFNLIEDRKTTPTNVVENEGIWEGAGGGENGDENGGAEELLHDMDIEMDPISSHPSFTYLLLLIQQITSKQLTPVGVTYSGKGGREQPEWMNKLLEVFSTSVGSSSKGSISHQADSSIAVRQFIGRLIVQIPSVFRPYAQFWLNPMIELAADDRNGGPGLHSFRLDLIVTALDLYSSFNQQSDSTQPKLDESAVVDKDAVVRLVEFVVKHTPAVDNSSLQLNNIRLLYSVVIRLGKFISYNSSSFNESCLVEMVLTDDNDNKETMNRRLAAMQMAAALMDSNIDPLGNLTRSNPKKATRFVQAIIKEMSGSRSIKRSKIASETVGITLRFLADRDGDESIKKLVEAVRSSIQSLSGYDYFIHALYAIVSHYPKLVDSFVGKTVEYLPRVSGDLRRKCLEILGFAEEKMKEVVTELVTSQEKLVFNMLHSSDGEEVGAVLNLIRMGLSKMGTRVGLGLFGGCIRECFQACITHRSVVARSASIQLAIRIFDNSTSSTTADEDIEDVCRQCLLSGLSDSNEAVKGQCYRFWTHETRLSGKSMSRIVELLERGWHPRTERQFIAYTSQLLLDRCSASTEFNRSLFKDPLQQCQFQVQNIRTEWKMRNSSLKTPAFAGSYIAPSGGDQSMGSSMLSVRATQSFIAQFTQTQTEKPDWGATADQMMGQTTTGGNNETYADVSQTMSQSLSAFAFPTRRPSSNTNQQSSSGGAQNAASSGGLMQPSKSDLARIQRRILKDSTETSYMFARHQTRRNQLRQKLAEERAEARGQKVHLNRTYRTGYLPDIQINHSAVINPLKALAKMDANVGSTILGGIISQVLVELMTASEGGQEGVELMNRLQNAIHIILEKSPGYTPFLSMLFTLSTKLSRWLSLDSFLVARAGLTASEHATSVLYLEQKIVDAEKTETVEEPKEKRSRQNQRQEEDRNSSVLEDRKNWMALASVYSTSDQTDSLYQILKNKVTNSSELLCQALEAQESLHSLPEAVEFYNKVLIELGNLNVIEGSDEEEIVAEQEDLISQTRDKCLQCLGDWDRISSITQRKYEIETNGLDSIWNEPIEQEGIQNLIASNVRQVLSSKRCAESTMDIYQTIQTWTKRNERKKIIQKLNNCELGWIQLADGKLAEASEVVEHEMDCFLAEWGNIEGRIGRRQRINALLPIVTIKHPVQLLHKFTTENVESAVAVLRRLLSADLPKMSSSVLAQDISLSRMLIGRHLDLKEKSVSTSGSMEIEIQQNLLRSAIDSSNLHLAQKIFRRLSLETSANEASDSLPLLEAKINLLQGKSENSVDDILSGVRCLSKASEKHAKVLIQSECLLWLLDNFDVLKKSSESLSKIAKEVHGKNTITEEELMKVNFDCLTNGMKKWENHASKFIIPLVDFCDNVIQKSDMDEVDLCMIYGESIVTNVLRCLHEGSPGEAGQLRLPRILSLLQSYPHQLGPIFLENSKCVPSWRFLDWLNCVVSLLTTPAAFYLTDLLKEVAVEYPQAMIYPMKMAKENLKLDNDQDLKKKIERIEKPLEELDKVIDPMIAALNLLNQGMAAFKDVIDEYNMQRKEKSHKWSPQNLLNLFDENVFFSKGDVGPMIGKYWKEFAGKWSTKIKSIFKGGSSKQEDSIVRELSMMISQMRKEQSENRTRIDLAEYSPWLCDFDFPSAGIEIPGQYRGVKARLVVDHIRINSVDRRVIVMKSIRKPKVITIRGDNGREYKYLVKAGEDLRQDSRIEDILALVNNLLTMSSSSTSNKNTANDVLKSISPLVTYSVVPLTTKVGIIEFVPNVQDLKGFILDQMDDTDKDQSRPVHHLKDIGIKTFKDTEYLQSYEIPHQKAIDCFKKMSRSLRGDFLKGGLQSLCPSLRYYAQLRSHFIQSHASICAVHYLLGIGDRHQSNFMMNLSDGGMVGIDFGHAFGSATQLLPIPELIPFRLTNQITNVMEPIGPKGQFRATLARSLDVMRQNSHLLLSALEVFVREPSLDWQNYAKRQASAGLVPTDKVGEVQEWYPREKIRIVRAKLRGTNPVVIVKKELEGSSAIQKKCSSGQRKGLNRMLEGSNKENASRGFPLYRLTSEQQAECLIDMATDPVLLSRVWIGWEPWS